jgi:hypothetical protein
MLALRLRHPPRDWFVQMFSLMCPIENRELGTATRPSDSLARDDRAASCNNDAWFTY